MIKKSVTIGLADGLEARPIAMLVQTATKFSSSVYLDVENKRVNAKSIMGLMMLAAEFGSFVTLTTNGSDEKEAFDTIKNLFDNKFNEEF